MVSKRNVGNAAKHLWMAQLLMQDFDASLAASGDIGSSITCSDRKSGKVSRIRVKSAFDGRGKWYADKDGCIFREMSGPNDFVGIAVNFPKTRYYVVPTEEVDRLLREDFDFYISQPGRGGIARNPNSPNRFITFDDQEKPTDHGHGYAVKFAKYENAWDLLK